MYKPKSANATVSGRGMGSGGSSQGETAGVGSTYNITITERPNLAQTRNQDLTGPSSKTNADMGMVTMAKRKTGRI